MAGVGGGVTGVGGGVAGVGRGKLVCVVEGQISSWVGRAN